jgi:YihY family inner membrane protein
VSTASLVPETFDLSGDDAWTTLSRVGKRRLLKDAFMRMRVADGFSHARSIAFMTTLLAVQGVIGLVGLASLFDKGSISSMVVATIRRAVPGSAGQVLTSAVIQAHATALEHRYSALVFGLAGCLVTGTTVMGQLERGLNRLYGVERDRPTVQKYGLALAFAVSAGTFIALAFGCLAFGREILHTGNRALNTAWAIGRWPLGLALIAVAVTLLFRWSPRRRQPRLSWLSLGAGVSVLLWAIVTVGLGVFYRFSSSFGQTYGPLAGLIALLLWCLLSAIALLLGAAVAAQLESVRTGEPAPQDAEKVAESEPDAYQTSVPVPSPVQVAS